MSCWSGFLLAAILAAASGGPLLAAEPGPDPDQAIAVELAELLRAGRSVVSAHQAEINDPGLGDKHFSGAVLTAEADALFAQKNGVPPQALELSDRDRRLLDALARSMAAVVDAQQPAINQPGVGFKGFIPAVFGRLTNESFVDSVGTEARIRVTAPLNLVRNRKARPDDWERQVIETRFLSPTWVEGEPYAEVMQVDSRPAFRIMMPEYYSPSCLSCHGTPKGEVDITGYPKEGAAVGDLSGAISITIFK